MKQALVRRVTLLLGGKSDQAGPQRGEVPVQSGSPTSESYGEGFASPAWPRAATSTAPWRTVGEHVGSDWAQTGCNGARRSDLLKELRALQSRFAWGTRRSPGTVGTPEGGRIPEEFAIVPTWHFHGHSTASQPWGPAGPGLRRR